MGMAALCVLVTTMSAFSPAVGEEMGKMMMGEEGSFSLAPLDTAGLIQHSNGPVGGYSPPSDVEGIGQVTSDEE